MKSKNLTHKVILAESTSVKRRFFLPTTIYQQSVQHNFQMTGQLFCLEYSLSVVQTASAHDLNE